MKYWFSSLANWKYNKTSQIKKYISKYKNKYIQIKNKMLIGGNLEVYKGTIAKFIKDNKDNTNNTNNINELFMTTLLYDDPKEINIQSIII